MGKNIRDYIKNLNCPEEFTDIMTVEHRSNNPKRDFLFCNKIQGKHIPATPDNIYKLFNCLTEKINDTINSIGYGWDTKPPKILVVGFAETATAIGGYIADHLEHCVYYLQTTRENLKNTRQLIEFEEEHSHATEQYLFGDLEAIRKYDYILFIDDEISTGKTILNFITEFNKINPFVKYGVASICNWQNKENRVVYQQRGIDTFYLISGELIDASMKMNVTIKPETQETQIGGVNLLGDTREQDDTSHRQNATHDTCENKTFEQIDIGVDIFNLERAGRIPNNKYYSNTKLVIEKIVNWIESDREAKINSQTTSKPTSKPAGKPEMLVIGTEEFMYYPMMVSKRLSEIYRTRNVYFQAPSRSSIDVIEDNTDGIVNKHKLHSAYDINRQTFVYNLKTYDKVIVITDSCNDKALEMFKNDILKILKNTGNIENDIMLLNIRREGN